MLVIFLTHMYAHTVDTYSTCRAFDVMPTSHTFSFHFLCLHALQTFVFPNVVHSNAGCAGEPRFSVSVYSVYVFQGCSGLLARLLSRE